MRSAYSFCFLIPTVYAGVALFCPPSLYFDPAWGFVAWRSFLEGAPIFATLDTDQHNISLDNATLRSWWSPGQYLFPGIISLTGLPMGVSIVLTCWAALCASLIGCVKLCRHFGLDPTTTLCAILLMSTFRYSTLPFRIYNGGEVLLQGALPWVVLMALRVPSSSMARGAAFAFAAVAIGFLAKWTGVIVAGAALAAASGQALIDQKRISPGTIGGVFGATLAVTVIYFIYFSRADTPLSGAEHMSSVEGFFLSLIAPWAAGFGAMDLLTWLFVNPHRPVWSETWPLIVLSAPLAASIVALLLLGRKTVGLQKLLGFTFLFCLGFALALALLYVRGSYISIEERHVRPPGILVFLCALAVAFQYSWRHPVRLAVVAFASFMSFYGLTSFAVGTTAQFSSGRVDAYSRTTQPNIDPGAIDFMHAAYRSERRGALFVLLSADIALTLPNSARTLIIFPVESIAARRYRGVVEGNVYIVIPRSLEQARGESLRAAFVEYSSSGWQFRDFGDTRVYFQRAAIAPPSSPL